MFSKEERPPPVIASESFGKLGEPVLVLTKSPWFDSAHHEGRSKIATISCPSP
jgi:hypothetical protein